MTHVLTTRTFHCLWMCCDMGKFRLQNTVKTSVCFSPSHCFSLPSSGFMSFGYHIIPFLPFILLYIVRGSFKGNEMVSYLFIVHQ